MQHNKVTLAYFLLNYTSSENLDDLSRINCFCFVVFNILVCFCTQLTVCAHINPARYI